MPKRRYPVHPVPVERFNQPVVVFCTVCILDGHPLLNNDMAMKAIQLAWQDAKQWQVGEFMLMPDHLHFFCVPGVLHPENVKKWCRFWKRMTGQHSTELKGRWQMDVWDTQMRDADHYTEKLSYMRQNPVRGGLASDWTEWPFKGVMHEIRW